MQLFVKKKKSVSVKMMTLEESKQREKELADRLAKLESSVGFNY